MCFPNRQTPILLIEYLNGDSRQQAFERDRQIEDILDADFAYTLPESQKQHVVSALLPVVFGCSHACAYCVIPLRRGREISRQPQEILAEAQTLAAQGVKEITLLGQIVDRYGAGPE